MAKIDLSLLGKKFRGSMLGVLIGDCLGSPYQFETLSAGTKLVLQKSFDKLEGPVYKAPVIQYTDDSAMSKALAESLIEKKDVDVIDIAKKYVKTYYQEPFRDYGNSVVIVFEKLRGSKFSDVFQPAQDQFNGQGSFGNGAAMRIAPLALMCYNNYNYLVDMVKKQTRITHTNKIGIDGAILQAIAIQQSIQLHPDEQLHTLNFVDELINKMNKLEKDEEGLDLVEAQPYKRQLNLLKNLLLEKEDKDSLTNKVVKELGNDVSALRSVPTAIFCFLRAQSPIQGINTENKFRRAIQYAVSLGGDTDTIASMTGAIAGAFHGVDKVPPNFIHHCEASAQFEQLADDLFKVATAADWNSAQK